MFRAAFCVLPLVTPTAHAMAQQAPDPGVVQSYLEGCLQTSHPQGPEAALDFCKCTAKLIFPGPGAPSSDPTESMMQCMPAMRELLGDG